MTTDAVYALWPDGEKKIDISPSNIPDARMVLNAATRTLWERTAQLAEHGRRTWPENDRLRVRVHLAAGVLADDQCRRYAEEIARYGGSAGVALSLEFCERDQIGNNPPFPSLAAFGGSSHLRTAGFLGTVTVTIREGEPAALPAAS